MLPGGAKIEDFGTGGGAKIEDFGAGDCGFRSGIGSGFGLRFGPVFGSGVGGPAFGRACRDAWSPTFFVGSFVFGFGVGCAAVRAMAWEKSLDA